MCVCACVSFFAGGVVKRLLTGGCCWAPSSCPGRRLFFGFRARWGVVQRGLWMSEERERTGGERERRAASGQRRADGGRRAASRVMENDPHAPGLGGGTRASETEGLSTGGDPLPLLLRERPPRREGARARARAVLSFFPSSPPPAPLFASVLTDVDEAAVVLHALAGAARGLLLLLLRRHLGRLAAHLAGTGERAVNLACCFDGGVGWGRKEGGKGELLAPLRSPGVLH